MAPRRVGIRDVAAAAGVSAATVSRALNGYPDVAPETRERIAHAARRLGYRPAAAARTVRTGRSGLVGVCLHPCGEPAELQPFGRMVAAAATRALTAAGAGVLAFEDVDSLRAAREARQLDALVLVCLGDDTVARAGLDRWPAPVVGVDVELGARPGWTIRADSHGGLRRAVARLAALGHRRIAYVGGSPITVPGRERLAAFRAGMRAAGLRPRAELERAGTFRAPSGHAAALQLLSLRRPPTAIVAASDEMALGAIAAARDLGRDVPGDVSVVGFDDSPLAALAPVGLTSVRQDPERIGALAARAALRGGEGGGRATVPVDLVERASIGPTYTPPLT
ncbi:MAG TPA: LacI family DNA-binding transcriptional regulator [Capillimicrobium sp.]|nr:LacI family DNA-binding transcriptional regulator [Capillimicrobium sp.]